MKPMFFNLLVGLLPLRLMAQETPTDIPKKELPKTSACVICSAHGERDETEKAVAGVRYKGKAYYFCNKGEVAQFKADPEAYMPPVLPRPAPEKFGVKLEGTSASLADFKGKVVLVDFWATWCVPCVKAMPDLQKLQEKYAEKGLSVVGISIDEKGAEKVKPFLSKRKFTYTMLLDKDTAHPTWKAFGVHGIPALFLINREGVIVQQWTGKVEMKEVKKAVEALLENR
jgi:peroxiredoxin/YHS domain-containing protein